MKELSMAFLVALLLWLVAGLLFVQPRVLELPLEVRGLSSDLVVAESLPGVKIFVKSSGQNPSGIEAFLDLSEARMPVRLKEAVQVSGGERVIAFWPREVRVVIERATSRSFIVESEVQEFPPSGFAIQSLVLEPSEVVVYGGERMLQDIARVALVVNLRGQRSNRSFTLAPAAYDAQNRILHHLIFSPPQVKVRVEIAPGDDTKVVVVEPTFENNLPAGFTLREVALEPKVVSIRGAVTLLQNLTSLPTTPINLAGHFQDFEEEVALRLPPHLALLGSPNVIRARIALNSSVTTTTLKLVPRYLGLAESLELVGSAPSMVEVVLSGASEKISDLNSRNLELAVDLTGLISGSHKIVLDKTMVKAPPGLEAVSFEPKEVEVELRRRWQ